MALRSGLGNQLMPEPHARVTQVPEQPPSTSNTGASSTPIWGQASVADGKGSSPCPQHQVPQSPSPTSSEMLLGSQSEGPEHPLCVLRLVLCWIPQLSATPADPASLLLCLLWACGRLLHL